MEKIYKTAVVFAFFASLACGAKPKSEAQPPPPQPRDSTADKLNEKCEVKFSRGQSPEEILFTADQIRRSCDYDEGQIQLMAERVFKD